MAYVSCQRVIDGRRVGRDVGMRCRVGSMSLATSCDITRHHAIGSGSGSGPGGIRRHSSEGVAEERRGGGSGSGRRAGVRSVRGSPYKCASFHSCIGMGNSVMQTQHKLGVFGTDVMHGFSARFGFFALLLAYLHDMDHW